MSSNPVLTLGMFDGVHLGHQSVIHEVLEIAKAKNLESHVLTFVNHPLSYLRPEKAPLLITPLQERLNLIRELGPSKVICLPFDDAFANLTAEEFLIKFNPSTLVLGHDAKIGKNRAGDPAHLLSLSSTHGFDLIYLHPFKLDGNPVSSSRIRKSIEEADFIEAEHLLGRPYSLFYTRDKDNERILLPPDGYYQTSINGKVSNIEIINRKLPNVPIDENLKITFFKKL